MSHLTHEQKHAARTQVHDAMKAAHGHKAKAKAGLSVMAANFEAMKAGGAPADAIVEAVEDALAGADEFVAHLD